MSVCLTPLMNLSGEKIAATKTQITDVRNTADGMATQAGAKKMAAKSSNAIATIGVTSSVRFGMVGLIDACMALRLMAPNYQGKRRRSTVGAEGTNTGHENAEGMACVGVRLTAQLGAVFGYASATLLKYSTKRPV